MGPAADIALATGVISGINELIFAPLAGNGKPDFNWRLIPATAIFALGVQGLSGIAPQIAMGVAVTALLTALLTNLGKAGSPVLNASKALGYTK